MNKQPLTLRPLPQPRVEIINLIDVMITLVAFFMLTTVFAGQQQRLELELPVVERGEQTPSRPEAEFLLLELAHDGTLTFEGSLLPLSALPAVLREENRARPVLLRADRNCPYEMVVQIIDQLKAVGLHQLALEVKTAP
jgi:biopolymer transport protein TolR